MLELKKRANNTPDDENRDVLGGELVVYIVQYAWHIYPLAVEVKT